MGAGEQMFLGIRLTLDASGVVTGASLAKKSMLGVEEAARRTQKSMPGIPGVATAKAKPGANLNEMAMGFGMVGAAAYGAGKMIETKFLGPAKELALEIEAALSSLKFISEASDKEMVQMESLANKIGRETLLTTKESIEGLTMFASAGWDVQKSMKGLPAAVSLVTGLQKKIELGEASKALAVLTDKFFQTGETAEGMAAKMIKAANAGLIEAQDFGPIANSIRSTPLLMGDAAHEMLAAVSILKGGGMQAADAAHSYASFSRPLLKGVEQMDKWMKTNGKSMEQFYSEPIKKLPAKARALKDFGIQVFDPYTKKIKPTLQLLKEFGEKAVSMSQTDYKKFLISSSRLLNDDGRNTLIAMVAYAKRTGKTVSQALEEGAGKIAQTKGVLKAAEESFSKTTKGMIENYKGSIEGFLSGIGKKIVGIEKGFLALAVVGAGSLAGLVQGNDELATVIAGTAMAMSILLKVVGLFSLAAAGALLWSSLLGPAIVRMGGAAAVAAVGMKVMTVAMKGFLIGAGGLLVVMGLVYGALWLWKKIWAKDAQGIFKVIGTTFNDIKMIGQAFFDWMDGSSTNVDLFKSLQKRNLVSTVITLLQIKDRVVAIVKGMWDSIKKSFTIPVTIFTVLGKVINWVGDKWADLTGRAKHSNRSIEDSVKSWETFGKVLGWMAMVIIPLYVAKMVIAIAKTVAFTAVQWAMNPALAVASIKFLLIAAAVLVVVGAYAILIYQSARLGEWWGETLPKVLGTAIYWFALAATYLKTWGTTVADFIVEGFKGNFEPFLAYVMRAFELIKTAAKFAIGEATWADVGKAFEGVSGVTQEKRDALKMDSDQAALGDLSFQESGFVNDRVKRRAISLEKEKGGGRGGREIKNTTTIGKVEIVTQGMSPEDAAAASKQFLEKVSEEKDKQATIGFGSAEGYF